MGSEWVARPEPEPTRNGLPDRPLTLAERDSFALKAAGIAGGGPMPLPHPTGCQCSEHPKPCPHDIRHFMRGYFDTCARCGIDWPWKEASA